MREEKSKFKRVPRSTKNFIQNIETSDIHEMTTVLAEGPIPGGEKVENVNKRTIEICFFKDGRFRCSLTGFHPVTISYQDT